VKMGVLSSKHSKSGKSDPSDGGASTSRSSGTKTPANKATSTRKSVTDRMYESLDSRFKSKGIIRGAPIKKEWRPPAVDPARAKQFKQEAMNHCNKELGPDCRFSLLV
jgi:hypothetical protein